MKIVCVIPTFNRINLLGTCLAAVEAQERRPDHIVVVNNRSSDGTAAWLGNWTATRPNTTVMHLETNEGGAGGYCHGIRKACELGADWIWTLDDDAIPDPTALRILTESGLIGRNHGAPDVGFLASNVLWHDGSPHVMNAPGLAGDGAFAPGIRKISYASFVSLLINRKTVEEVGLPIKEFFLYSDDVEFTSRIVSNGFDAFLVDASTVKHMTRTNTGFTLDRMDISPGNADWWQRAVRNLVAVNRRLSPFGWVREPARLCLIAAKLLTSTTPWPIRFSIMQAGFEGLFMRYEKWIEYPAAAAPGNEDD